MPYPLSPANSAYHLAPPKGVVSTAVQACHGGLKEGVQEQERAMLSTALQIKLGYSDAQMTIKMKMGLCGTEMGPA